MIRPEVRRALWRRREVLGALAFAALGLWWGAVSFGVLQWLGWGMVALGVGLAVVAAQKLRFTSEGDGPGVVTLDERRVTYLGPLDGGVADLDLLVQLDLTASNDPHWRLISASGHHLDIPVNAAGADALFDLFASLPGMRTEYMLSVLKRRRKAQMTVWIAPDHKPNARLH